MPCWGVAQDSVQLFSLEQAIQYAYDNNPEIKIAQIGIADAEQQIYENRAVGLPKLNATVNYQYFLQLPVSLIPAQFFDPTAGPDDFAEVQFGTKNNLTASLNLDAQVFDASFIVALAAAREFRVYKKKELEYAKQQVKKNVTLAYLSSLIYDENQAILDSNLKNLERILFSTKALYKNGFSEQLDIDRLELSKADLLTQRKSLDFQRHVALNNLKFMMGYPLDKPIGTTEKIATLIAGDLGQDVEALKLNINQRLEYQVAESGIRLSELNVRNIKAKGYMPTLDAFGTYQQSLQKNNLLGARENGWLPTAIIGLRLYVPIFDGLGRSARIQRATLDLEEAQRQKTQLLNSIQLEVNNAKIKYQDASGQVKSRKQNLTLAEKIYKTTNIKYNEGIGSSLEVRQAESDLYAAQQAYITALFQLLLAKAELDNAVGR